MKALHCVYLVLAAEVLGGCASYSAPSNRPYEVYEVYGPVAPVPYAVLPPPFIYGGSYGYPYAYPYPYGYPYRYRYPYAHPRLPVPRYPGALGPRTPNWRYGGSSRPGRHH